jgi:Ran GTPase-activating protein (RanGAP) involved in mRNA processing and transport
LEEKEREAKALREAEQTKKELEEVRAQFVEIELQRVQIKHLANELARCKIKY